MSHWKLGMFFWFGNSRGKELRDFPSSRGGAHRRSLPGEHRAAPLRAAGQYLQLGTALNRVR